MKKRIWLGVLVALSGVSALIGCVACGGSSSDVGGNNGGNNGGGKPETPVVFEWSYNDLPTGGVELYSTTAKAPDTTLTIPATIEGKRVKAIAQNGLKGFTNLQRVTFDEDCEILSLGSYAFSGCSGLTAFSVPDTVEALGDRVFSDCPSLSFVEIPVSVDTVGKFLFIGDNTTKLDVYCAAVAKPSGWSDYYASNRTSGSHKDFTFWWSAKQAEYSLKDYRACVMIDNTVAITHYDGKDYELNIPDEINGRAVSRLSTRSFQDCTTVQTVTFPENLKAIDASAFSGCTLLESVSFPDTLENLGEEAFYGCTSLKYAEIPLSVETVGSFLFMGCNKTKLDVYCAATAKPSGWSNYYASNSRTSSYKDFNFWWGMTAAENSVKGFRAGVLIDGTVAITHYDGKDYDLTVPEEINGKPITKIMPYAFSSANTVQTIQLPSALAYVGEYAFENCLLLSSVTLPSGVTEVGQRAFRGCSALTSAYLPATVSKLGDFPFIGCDTNKLTVYCGATAKPSGWSNYYASNRTSGTYKDFNFVWGASSID